MAAMSQVCETTIVVAASHADAIALSVECDSWRNDHVEVSRIDQDAAHGFPDTELISFELRVRCHFAKRHFGAGAQNRDKNALVCAPTSFDDVSRIDFVMHRQETRKRLACIPGARCAHAIANNFGRTGAFVGRHVASSIERTLAE